MNKCTAGQSRRAFSAVLRPNPLHIGIPKDWVTWGGLLKNNQAQQLFIAALDKKLLFLLLLHNFTRRSVFHANDV